MKLKKEIQTCSRLILLMFCFLFSLGMFAGLPSVSGKEATHQINLTDNEKAWLKEHPIIKLAPDPEFKPIEFFDQKGFYTGIAADFAQLLEQKLGIKFEVIRCANWDDVTQRIKNREVDVLNAVVKTPQREVYLIFPTPYLKIPSVIITRNNVNAHLSLDMLEGMKVVMVSGYGYVDLIRIKYPKLNIELVPELKTALRKVSFGMVDAFVGDLATTSFYIESEGITNLKLAGETDPPNISGFAVRSDWPELSNILEKGMALITEDEKKSIFKKWIHLTVEPGMAMQEIKRYSLIIACIILILIICFLLWNRQLKRVVNLRTEDLRKEIEERRRTEKALGQSESYLRTLIHTIPELVWLKDKDGIYLFCNSRFERFFGAKEEKIIGKTDYDFVDKSLADLFRENDKLAMFKDGSSINEEEVTYADDGHHEILETIKTPMYDSDGQLFGVLGIARDITERMQAEKERKKLEGQLRQSHKMEAIGTLAGGIAHDFNNILSSVLGFTELAKLGVSGNKDVIKHLDHVLTAGIRARDLVKHILTFSRRADVQKGLVEITPLIKECLKFLKASVPSNVEIKQSFDAEDSVILADPTQIHQVLMNFFTNSAYAMKNKGGVLDIRLKSIEIQVSEIFQINELKPGRYIQLTITDTGCGIPKMAIKRIFEPFFTTKERGEGTGMGLSIAYGIIKDMNGAITVHSEPGLGTTFQVIIPEHMGEPVTGKVTVDKPLATGEGRILLVDDEASIVDWISQILLKLGYKVTGLRSSLETFKLFKQNPNDFDLVLTDMTMPHMNGIELSRQIIALRPDIPIILCTGFSEGLTSQILKNNGIVDMIMKPMIASELAQTVSRALDKGLKHDYARKQS